MVDQLIFIDTEFTNFSNPQLISIGLAASTGEVFYAEVPYSVSDCSEFVREIVIPLLSSEPPCSYDKLHIVLRDWFAVVKGRGNMTICYDANQDKDLFLQIFDQRPPNFLNFRNVGERHVNELLRHEFHTKEQLPEHHALHDACAMRYAFREWPPMLQVE